MVLAEMELKIKQAPLPYLSELYYQEIGDRKDKEGKIPFWEEPDLESNLFPTEERLSTRLLEKSNEYMPWEDMALVNRALALALWAHQTQYRDSKDPYSTHFLSIAIELAEKYELDAVTISSALLHDSIEDITVDKDIRIEPDGQKPLFSLSPEMKEIIKAKTSEEVVHTVNDLTKVKARYLRREIDEDEMSRLKIIMSLLDNPRVAIIKVFDRLHNMRTLSARPRSKRMKTIYETQQIYVPLAKRIGLFEEADELDELCLRMQDEEHDQLATEIEEVRLAFYSKLPYEDIELELKKSVDGARVTFDFRIPGVNDIFRRMGVFREVRNKDLYLHIDTVLKSTYQADNSLLEWGREANRIANQFNWLEDYELIEEVNEIQFRKELEASLTDSLTVRIRRKQDGLEIRLNIFPQDAYEREQINLTKLYHQKDHLMRLPAELNEEQREALAKLTHMKEKYEHLFNMLKRGEVVTTQALRFFEPRLPEGFIRVVGINERGEEGVWIIREGSTVMDYAKDINATLWSTTKSVSVNGNQVDFNYVLQLNDVVRVHFGEKGQNIWNPKWIHCFNTDNEGRKTTQRNVRRMLERAEAIADLSYLMMVLQVGKWRIEQELEPRERPLRVGLHWARQVLERRGIKLSEKDFLLQVALGENENLTEDLICEVAKCLAEANKHVGRITVLFTQDNAGQANAVTRIVSARGVSALNIEVQTLGKECPSKVIVFYDPDDKHQMPEIVRKIKQDQRCTELGLAKVTYSNY